jgi:hypothetical protein
MADVPLDARDIEHYLTDIERIWPHCTFGSEEEAVEAFYAAYPLENPDEFLADHLRNITG